MASKHFVVATLVAVSNGGNFQPMANGGSGRFNLSVSGSFTGTWILQRSFDDGTTWFSTTTTGTAVAESQHQDTERDVLYRVRCSVWTSGTSIIARLSA